MNDHNHVSIVGRLTRDPEIRSLQSGTALCTFSIAVNKSYISNGEKKEEVSYFNCVCWGKLAEIVNQYCRKGKQVIIGGSLKQDSWQNQEGRTQTAVKINVDTLQMIGPRDNDDGGVQRDNSGYSNVPDYPASIHGHSFDGSESSSPAAMQDDDIPF